MELTVESLTRELGLQLVSGAERFRRDPELMAALLTLARHEHSRECLLLLEAILETPGLMPRLTEVLRPKLEPNAQQHQPKQLNPRQPGARKQGAKK